MAGTIEKRITFTPSPAVGPLLRELSKLTDKAPSMIIREILDEALPVFPALIEAYRTVKKRPEHAQAVLARMSNHARQELDQAEIDFGEALKKKPGRKKKGRGAANTG